MATLHRTYQQYLVLVFELPVGTLQLFILQGSNFSTLFPRRYNMLRKRTLSSVSDIYTAKRTSVN